MEKQLKIKLKRFVEDDSFVVENFVHLFVCSIVA